jgi:hypothetical protein
MRSGRCDFDIEASCDQGFHLFGMGDQTYRPHFVSKRIERLQSGVQCLVIERAKSLVDENGVEPDSAAILLNDV